MSSFNGYRSSGGDRRRRNNGGSVGNGQRRAGPGRGVQGARVARDGGPKFGKKGRLKVNKRGGKPLRVGHRGGGFGRVSQDFIDGLEQGLAMRIGHRM